MHGIKNIQNKLFLIKVPIDGLSAESASTVVESLTNLLPSENEVFEGKYHYKFLVIPTPKEQTISIVELCKNDLTDKKHKNTEDAMLFIKQHMLELQEEIDKQKAKLARSENRLVDSIMSTRSGSYYFLCDSF